MSICALEGLKLQLKSAVRRRFVKEQVENRLRTVEHNLTAEIQSLSNEIDFLTNHLEELAKEISEQKHQMEMIDIWYISEQSKIEQQRENLRKHVKGFKDLLSKEQNSLQLKYEDFEDADGKADETDIQLSVNEIQNKKAVAVEAECISIERECIELKKRNKTIMLDLKRNLIEADKLRRSLDNKKKT